MNSCSQFEYFSVGYGFFLECVYLRLLQNLHPKIKFTMEHSSKELPFLDILIKNVNGQIIIDLYHKPTIPPLQKSPPQKNCIKSILYTLARRIYIIKVKVKVKLATIVEGDPKAPFSIATTPRCRGGRYSIPRIAPLYPWTVPYNAEC